jgi:hypothetical protein
MLRAFGRIEGGRITVRRVGLKGVMWSLVYSDAASAMFQACCDSCRGEGWAGRNSELCSASGKMGERSGGRMRPNWRDFGDVSLIGDKNSFKTIDHLKRKLNGSLRIHEFSP